jgi:hypothetical protein
MESKVLLYGADGKKIGETFMRRARQLVKQQRAMWMDGRQSAVQFVADTDNWETFGDKDESPIPIFDDEGWIVDLAKRRIRWRKLFIAHSVVFSIGTALLALILTVIMVTDFGHSAGMAADFDGDGTLGLVIALIIMWVAAFVAHACSFGINMSKVHRPGANNESQTRALDREVAEIKKLLDK